MEKPTRVAKLYDKVSEDYRNFDYCDILVRSNQAALDCIDAAGVFADFKNHDILNKPLAKMLDLGAGDGCFLEKFHHRYPDVALTGLDVSPKMLSLAQERIAFDSITAGIEEANQHLLPQTFDLIAANFVCAYVSLSTLLSQANYLLTPGGFVIITTSTFNSAPLIQQQIQQLAKSYCPWKRYIGRFLQKTLKNVKVPKDYNDILNIARAQGFKLRRSEHIIVPLNFDSAKDFFETTTRGGWNVSAFENSFLPRSIFYPIAKFFARCFKFPIRDQGRVEIVLLQKI